MESIDMITEPKPNQENTIICCPFCGKQPKIHKLANKFMIFCNCVGIKIVKKSFDECVKTWNTRCFDETTIRNLFAQIKEKAEYIKGPEQVANEKIEDDA